MSKLGNLVNEIYWTVINPLSNRIVEKEKSDSSKKDDDNDKEWPDYCPC